MGSEPQSPMHAEDLDAKVVIIGGGAIGLSIAYHLAELGWSDVLLLERNQLTSGTSWHAAGIVGPLRANMNLTKLAIYATELFQSIESKTGQATGYKKTGGLWLAQTPDRLTELKRIAAMGELNGLHVEMLSAKASAERYPLLRVEDITGALWVEEDGQTNPVDTCMAFAKGARQGGVRLEEGVGVATVHTKNGQVHAVETDDGRMLRCKYVINCTGAWSKHLAARSGVAVPVQAVEHMYVVTDSVPGLPSPCPIIRDLDGRIYIKEDAGKLVIGGFETNAKIWQPDQTGKDAPYLMFPEDWDQFMPFMDAGIHRLPVLEQVGIRHFMNGPEGFTPDTRQVMGEVPEIRNYFVAAGFNSIGIMSSAGVGKVMAEWIVGGEAPMDLWAVDINRHDASTATPAFLTGRIPEAVANQFEMHWPYKQMATMRDIRVSPLHRGFAEAGAVFGAPTGWERPLWFAQNESERTSPYSYGEQGWWPYAKREGEALRDRVALLELSPFTKIEIGGAGSEAFLQQVCAANIAVAPGQMVYGQMLNARGGIEADITVTRLADDLFRVVSGAATRTRDLQRLRRLASDHADVVLTDVTSSYAVLAVMGPRSRDLLARVSASDLSSANFPFGASREIDLGAVCVRASRVSYVGELGWELYIPAEFADYVHRLLIEAGGDVGLAHAGHYCLDGCRLEKGFRHWGHDIGPDDTPIEAGLSFAVAFDKGEFIGREALLLQRELGVKRRLVLFRIEGANPLLLHDEPIYRDGHLVGLTTSGGYGPRTGLALCLGYVNTEGMRSAGDIFNHRYEIGIAGQRFAATALKKPPYDPTGERMRA
jgi:4-methylaminobutanoate oxidase (formaldehyde-forming)